MVHGAPFDPKGGQFEFQGKFYGSFVLLDIRELFDYHWMKRLVSYLSC